MKNTTSLKATKKQGMNNNYFLCTKLMKKNQGHMRERWRIRGLEQTGTQPPERHKTDAEVVYYKVSVKDNTNHMNI
ncbi:hypothetical protein ABR38_13455 [Enterobacter kobei]|nr:hypothetical protein ABR38_13455 [Enterobacter kobei]